MIYCYYTTKTAGWQHSAQLVLYKTKKELLHFLQLFTMKEFLIQENDCGQRLDKFLRKAIPKLPQGMLYKFLRTKKIKVNRKRADCAQMLQAGDVVTCYIHDEFFAPQKAQTPKEYAFRKAPAELDIIYEDENLMLVYKPAGLVVHEDDHQSEDTLIARVLHYLYHNGSFKPEQEHAFSPALCNRLDRNTSGLVIAAKNAAALRELNRLIRENRIHKSYLCVTVSPPPKKQDTLHAWHYKPRDGKIVKISGKQLSGYREIITKYNVLARKDNLCLVKINLITGRTHQIRAHMAFAGAPLLGDDKYGNSEKNRAHRCKYQQLCAYRLQFEPEKESPLAYLNGRRFTCGIPTFAKKYFPDASV